MLGPFRILKSLGFGLVLFGALSVFAQTANSGSKTAVDDDSEEISFEQQFIQSNILISDWFDGTAEGIDLFLSGKTKSKKKNNSHFRIENSSFINEGDNFRNTSSLSLILRLPNLEEYWQLKFTSYDEDDERRSAQKSYLRNTPREKNYGATVGFFRKLGNIRTAFQPRIDLSDPLKVSHSLSFESIIDFKTYEANPKFELFATPDKGTGFYLAMNFNFPISNYFSFTLINNGKYEDRIHQFSTGNGFSLGEYIDRKSSIAYTWIYNCNNRDNFHLDSYGLAIAYSRLIYKRILDYQVVPHLDFAKEQTFKGVTGLTFNLNLNF